MEMHRLARVISADGTSIAYQRDGSGPAVILIGGGRGPVRAATDRSLGDDHTAHSGGHGRQR